MSISVSSIYDPEFINIKPYNPLISECQIKVLYIGENRNHSFISKEVAAEMANTLPGCPIVGYYKEDKKDFGDHGDRVILDGDGIKFQCLTKPYGFVAPDAKVWFQKFQEFDNFGNEIIREYLVTEGFLWTGQYEEAKQIMEDGGKPHSMELDEETLDGKWSKNQKTGIDFFIINDAIFSKLCILGDDVEPCFEGSDITPKDVNTSFSFVDNDFKKSLYTMMQELKSALKGGQSMAVQKIGEETQVLDGQVKFEKTSIVENQNSTEDLVQTSFAKEEDKEEEKKDKAPSNEEKEDKPSDEKKDKEKKDEYVKEEDKEDEKKKEEENKYSLLESQYQKLSDDYSNLKKQCEELITFKKQVEDKEKDNLINSFYMLSDEDKADVIANKSKYSLEDIESKLSVICVRKRVSFTQESENENNLEEKEVITTFNLNDSASNVPNWIKAIQKTTQSRNI